MSVADAEIDRPYDAIVTVPDPLWDESRNRRRTVWFVVMTAIPFAVYFVAFVVYLVDLFAHRFVPEGNYVPLLSATIQLPVYAVGFYLMQFSKARHEGVPSLTIFPTGIASAVSLSRGRMSELAARILRLRKNAHGGDQVRPGVLAAVRLGFRELSHAHRGGASSIREVGCVILPKSNAVVHGGESMKSITEADKDARACGRGCCRVASAVVFRRRDRLFAFDGLASARGFVRHDALRLLHERLVACPKAHLLLRPCVLSDLDIFRGPVRAAKVEGVVETEYFYLSGPDHCERQLVALGGHTLLPLECLFAPHSSDSGCS